MYHQQPPQFGSSYVQRPMPSSGSYGQYLPQQQQQQPLYSGLSHTAPMQMPLQSSMSGMHSSGGYPANTVYNSGGGRTVSWIAAPHAVPPTAAAPHAQVPTQHAAMAQAPTKVLQGHQHPWMAMTYQRKSQPPAPGGRDMEECGPLDRRRMCQDEQCGGEVQGPPEPTSATGLNWQHSRAMAMLGSTIASGWCQVFVVLPALRELSGMDVVPLQIAFTLMWLATVSLIFNGMFSDPGQLESSDSSWRRYLEWEAAKARAKQLRGDESCSDEEEEGGPEPTLLHRSKKTWRYGRPVVRYDHYCRWLGNSIGLLNHRQFFCMLMLLVAMSIWGDLVDGFVLVYGGKKLWGTEIRYLPSADALFSLLHLAYSMGISYHASGIFRIHFGLVSRNETGNEWKSNKNWRFDQSKHGPGTLEGDMSEREKEELVDTETYYANFNEWDKGFVSNCTSFWFHSRYDEDGNLNGSF